MSATPTMLRGQQLKLAVNGGLNKDTSGNLYVEGLESLSSDPGSPAGGDAWYNTTSLSPRMAAAGIVSGMPVILQKGISQSGVLVSVANTTTKTLVTPSLITLPAKFFNYNRMLRCRLNFFVQSITSPTVTFYFQVSDGTFTTAYSAPFVRPAGITSVYGQLEFTAWASLYASIGSDVLNVGYASTGNGLNDGNVGQIGGNYSLDVNPLTLGVYVQWSAASPVDAVNVNWTEISTYA